MYKKTKKLEISLKYKTKENTFKTMYKKREKRCVDHKT